MPIHTRPLQTSDLQAVIQVQSQCYPSAYWEGMEAFAAKLTGAPACSWVASQSLRPCEAMRDANALARAYLVCLPVDEETFPALNASTWQAPVQPTMLYIHDLAVSPTLRGTGAGAALIGLAHERARALGLQQMALVAVQGSVPFWERHGFMARQPTHAGLRAKLASFGSDATFMRRLV